MKISDLNKMSENEIVEYYRPIVRKIIEKYFKNHRKFSEVHMFSFDELEQFGMIGVMEGVRTFDATKGMKLSSHLFNRIISAINRYGKKASLRSVNNYSYDIVDTVSLNSHVEVQGGYGDEWINLLPMETDYYEKKNDDMLIEQAINKLLNEKSIRKDYIAFLICRMEGESVLKISKKFNISGYHVRNALKMFEAKTADMLKLEVK